MKFGTAHSCGDSRLSCVDCQGQVCPSCMEICPVGNRCKKCTARFASHVTKIPPMILARTVLVAAIVGFGFGWLPLRPFGGYAGLFIFFLAGFFIGQGIHKLANYKVGKKVVNSILAAVIAGALLSPGRDAMFGIGGMVQPGENRREIDAAVLTVASAASEKKAQQEFGKFSSAFNAKQGTYFRARTAFRDQGKKAQLWFDVDKIEGTTISGKLAQNDVEMPTLRAGAPVSIDLKSVDDWQYVNPHGEDVGAFTYNFLRETELKPEITRTFSASILSRFWTNFGIFLIGIICPIFRVRMRN